MCFYFYFIPSVHQRGGWVGGGGQTFSSYCLFPVQQTINGIGHRVKCFYGLATNTLKNKKRTRFSVAGQSDVPTPARISI